jgi:hypothetical protein
MLLLTSVTLALTFGSLRARKSRRSGAKQFGVMRAGLAGCVALNKLQYFQTALY